MKEGKTFFNKKVSIIFLVLIAIEIFYVSSLSFGPGPGMITIIPFAYHVIVFFLLSFFISTLIQDKKTKKSKIILAIIISVIFAILDEVHQIFVPYRGAGVEDVLIDSLGIFSGMLIFLFYKRKN